MAHLVRDRGHHSLADLTVDVHMEGDFGAVHSGGDNTDLLPTDTMKNTVYALARGSRGETIEEFARRLVVHFLDHSPLARRISVGIERTPWSRLERDGEPHPWAFISGGNERRTTRVAGVRDGDLMTTSGVRDLRVLKTTESAFKGFLRDSFTTLPETDDRIFATSITARWDYSVTPRDWDTAFAAARGAILDVFANTFSPSVQNTAYLMGQAVLSAVPEVREISLELPNLHYLPFDLTRFGSEDTGNVFHPVDEPSGQIAATVTRMEQPA